MVLLKPATVIQWHRKGFRLVLAVAIKITLRGPAPGELRDP